MMNANKVKKDWFSKKLQNYTKDLSSSIQYFQSISRGMQSQDLFEITIHLTFSIDFLVKRGRNSSFSVQKWLISIKNGLVFPRKWHLSTRENQLILSGIRVLFVRDTVWIWTKEYRRSMNLNKGVPVYFNSQLKKYQVFIYPFWSRGRYHIRTSDRYRYDQKLFLVL